MRMPTGVLGLLLPGLVLLATSGILTGQPAQEKGADKDGPVKPVEFKGEAKVSSHRYKLEKGAIYRITAKGDGFSAEVRVDGQFGAGAPFTPLPLNPLIVRGKFDLSQVIFAPTETKEYVIKVDFVPNSEIGKGPHTYTLAIERAKLKTHLAVQDPELKVSENTAKLELGKVYGITVTGRGFEPDVQILDDAKSKMSAYNNGKALGFGRDAEYVTSLTFAPTRTANYRILVAVGAYSKPRSEALAYETKVAELKTELVFNGQLNKQDPRYPARGGPHKAHLVKLQANKKYQIDMMSAAFDAYLFLEDDAGGVLSEDDDGGDGLNARIIFTPSKTGAYRVIATTFNRGTPGTPVSGPYTLIVMENPNAVPRFPLPPSVKMKDGFDFKK